MDPNPCRFVLLLFPKITGIPVMWTVVLVSVQFKKYSRYGHFPFELRGGRRSWSPCVGFCKHQDIAKVYFR